MKKKDFRCHDVYWYLPKRKTPFYYGTLWCKNSLNAISRKYIKQHDKSPTIKELKACYSYESEETELLNELEKRGLGYEPYLKLFD